MILDYVLGTIISSFFIRIGRGNRSKSEASRYDSTSGRIVYRLRKKIPMIRWFFQFQHSFLGYTIRS